MHNMIACSHSCSRAVLLPHLAHLIRSGLIEPTLAYSSPGGFFRSPNQNSYLLSSTRPYVTAMPSCTQSMPTNLNQFGLQSSFARNGSPA